MEDRSRSSLIVAAVLAATMFAGATPSRADSCSASASAVLSRSTGGSCGVALAADQVLTLSYRIRNVSIVDSGPNDGTDVAARILAGEKIVATLAQEESIVGSPTIPGLLTFVPVCPVGSAGGTKNAGDPCDPLLLECGTGVCGCESALPGVTCSQGGDPDKVTIDIGQDLAFTGGQQRTIAVIRVKATGHVGPPVTCGQFFTRMDSAGDIVEVNDPLCESNVTAGAQASADLHAPECTIDSDCGDPECNACADVGVDNHCALDNIGGDCGTDADTTDCVTPACVDDAGTGVCEQGQVDVVEGTACDNNGGTMLPEVECQLPLCDATGTCVNEADATQDGNACGTDANTGDCMTPACLAGACEQMQVEVAAGSPCDNNGGTTLPPEECRIRECVSGGNCSSEPDPAQDGDECTDTDAFNCHRARCASGGCDQDAVCDPAENAKLCRVTISDTIFDDANGDGIQDPGEPGIPGVDVDVYTCSGGSPSVLEGTDTTDASGLYSYTMPTCDPSETLAIDVTGALAGVLAGYTESPAFCDEADPSSCGAEVTPAVDSNCIDGVSDCRDILRGETDETVDCGYFAECDVAVTKEACLPAATGTGCTGGALAVLLQWTGSGALPAGSSVVVKGSSGAIASITLPADLMPGDNLVIPGQNGFTIDAAATAGMTKLGTSVTVSVDAITQEVFHTSCSCPDSYTVGGTAYHTNLVVGEPMCLDASSPDNPAGAKGYPSALWTLSGLNDPTLGPVFDDPDGDACNNQLSAAGGEACAIKDNHITDVRFEYVGAQGKATNCANRVAVSPKSQDSGRKYKCTGWAVDNEPVRIQVLAKDGSPVWYDSLVASVNLGDAITVRATAVAGKKELEGDTILRVISATGTKIEEVTIASTCRERWVNVGDVYGGFEVTGVAGTKGGALPEDQCPAVEYRYGLSSTAGVSVRVCDDQLGDLGVVDLDAGVPLSLSHAGQLVLVGDACAPLVNAVRVFPAATACPVPAASDPPKDCGSATATILPPPPPPYVCTKPIDSLTMTWNGPGPVSVTAWKGAVGSATLGTVSGVMPGQEVTFSGYAGSPNDVVWQVSGAVSGLSDFHVSCSDTNMDGPEDCGKPEGDGKALVGFLNLWLLEGISGGGATLDCTP